MIRGVIRPDEGQIDVKGLDMHSKRKPDARAHLGMINVTLLVADNDSRRFNKNDTQVFALSLTPVIK